MRLVWDYENGVVIDIETGEVVDYIVDFYVSEERFADKRVGSKISEEERALLKGTEIVKELNERGYRDVRGTFVQYKLGLTNKTVKSLEKVERLPEVPAELRTDFEYYLKLIERDPVLSARPKRSKHLMALVCAYVVNGKNVREVSKRYNVGEKTLRKLLALARERIIRT
ncbi:hypothetical protein [Ignicoccus hospitalis]|uniref:Uncharacterized protein n=1 Tax=Ignicoccus hospitalis (strain KIN4/I / DSM 18386 / JCM 14125) TaxID=453591 RepID=A8ACB0_IGNH4|nr:hypothetical protein [Ignicoccus hospitalis]ABU82562.1 hypothetical protein Igni_1386 [Ignicoccus hospitalis KIN4/I]HIH90727.1 hypothetical protein [Desulfurococcaceae archaeon]